MNLREQVGTLAVDEADLSIKKLDEYHAQLQELQKEKVILVVISYTGGQFSYLNLTEPLTLTALS